MHMADALISPAVGGAMWAAAAGAALYSINKARNFDEQKIPLMGVMGAFVFAVQMINFSIPGTGSSGHLGGGLLLAILLGPSGGFLTMASVLVIQALFFADGGLLALGCNVFNLGFYTCFIAYPFIYRAIVGNKPSRARLFTGTLLAAVAGLQLGSFSVVLETCLSGRTELPFTMFVTLMQPVHLLIGIVEGLVTASIVAFVWKARPEIIEHTDFKGVPGISFARLLVFFAFATVLAGCVFSWFASSRPDGLEWAISRISGREELESKDRTHQMLAAVQAKTAILPDYGFKADSNAADKPEVSWPAVSGGTSLSGLIGGLLTLFCAGFAGLGLMFIKRMKRAKLLKAAVHADYR